jgi:hypothetical protein
MPNILNQFQNKRTMSEGHEKERDEKCKGQIKRPPKIRVVLFETKKSQLFHW